MTTSRIVRHCVATVSAVAVSVLLVGGAAATISNDDAGRGIQNVQQGRGI